jgi:hypothetical protein
MLMDIMMYSLFVTALPPNYVIRHRIETDVILIAVAMGLNA